MVIGMLALWALALGTTRSNRHIVGFDDGFNETAITSTTKTNALSGPSGAGAVQNSPLGFAAFTSIMAFTNAGVSLRNRWGGQSLGLVVRYFCTCKVLLLSLLNCPCFTSNANVSFV